MHAVMSALDPVRIGCLGAARIAPAALVYPAHVRGDVELIAVAARDEARATAFAAQHGFAEALPDYDSVVSHPDIDLIYNPLPIDAHAPWTLKALEAGKHVLCEKPFAMNANEARAMIDAATRNGRRVIEAFHHRYHPAFQTMLDWIDDGRIGAVKEIDAVFNVAISDKAGAEIRHQPVRGGGAFMDLGCYPLSWALSVVDAAPVAVDASATLTPRGVDEAMTARLQFASGAAARLSASMAMDKNFESRLTVTGESDVIEFVNPVQPHRGASLRLKSGEGVPVARLSTYTYQLGAVVDALSSGEELPTEGAATLRQQETIDAIYAAAGLSHLRETGVRN